MNEYLEILLDQFRWDLAVFSKPWLYWPLLIPAAGYFTFFLLKWTVLTAPIWLPIKLIIAPLKLPDKPRRIRINPPRP